MALFNYAKREITFKIVYYGPRFSGKTTSLQYIHERIAPAQRGRLLSLATESDRKIFFDLLPLKLGEIRGFKLRFQLYAVPGQVKYNKTRKLVLQGADAIVFVADSRRDRKEANTESFRNLQENLEEQGRQLKDIPLVFQYNKRDLDDVFSIEELGKILNPHNLPYFPAIASKGSGIMEALEAISKLTLLDIKRRLMGTIQEEEQKEAEEKQIEIKMIKGEGMLCEKVNELILQLTRNTKDISDIDFELVPSSEYHILDSKNRVFLTFTESEKQKEATFLIIPSTARQIAISYKINQKLADRPIYINSIKDNPYVYGDPVSEEQAFFGRKKELEQLIQSVAKPAKQDTLVIGERRTGKTSLLYQVEQRIESPFISVYIVLNTAKPDTDL